MTDECSVCGRALGHKEGLISSTNVLVCSDICKERYLDTLPGKGKGQLTVFSRVTGYITPVQAWNKGKLQEYRDRKKYSLQEIGLK